MVLALSTLLAALFFGGLALLAQHARKNRGAEITLVVALLAVSLLILLAGVFVGIGLFFLASQGGSAPQQAAMTATGVAVALAGLVGTGLCIPPLAHVFRGPKNTPRRNAQAADAPSSEASGGGEVLRERSFWTDPPMFFAIWLFALVVLNNVAGILAFGMAPEATGEAISGMGRLSVLSVVSNQIPFIIVAAAGVGLFVTRDFRGALSRLGYGTLSLKHLGVVGLFVVGALGVSLGADRIFAVVQPDLYRTVGDLSEAVFSPQGLNPVSAVLFALLIGLGAGLGEETLFRGAVQPKLGILLTSILFASMHVQYGPSVLLVFIFLLSVALGFLRRHVNTTAAVLAHAGYNASGVLLAYFFGI